MRSHYLKYKIHKNINSVQQPLESTHQELSLSNHIFRFCCTVQDLEVLLVSSNSSLAVEGLRIDCCWYNYLQKENSNKSIHLQLLQEK